MCVRDGTRVCISGFCVSTCGFAVMCVCVRVCACACACVCVCVCVLRNQNGGKAGKRRKNGLTETPHGVAQVAGTVCEVCLQHRQERR